MASKRRAADVAERAVFRLATSFSRATLSRYHADSPGRVAACPLVEVIMLAGGASQSLFKAQRIYSSPKVRDHRF